MVRWGQLCLSPRGGLILPSAKQCFCSLCPWQYCVTRVLPSTVLALSSSEEDSEG